MSSAKPLIYIISTLLLGSRISFKDVQATPAELIYYTNLRNPEEFFITEDIPADPQIFFEKYREYMRPLRPIQTRF